MTYILDSDVMRMAGTMIPKLFVEASQDGTILWNNTPVERLFGYDYGELLHKPVEILVPDAFKAVHPSHRTGVTRDPKGQLMAGGRGLTGRRKNGSEIQVSIWLVRGTISGTEGILAVVFDMTKRIM